MTLLHPNFDPLIISRMSLLFFVLLMTVLFQVFKQNSNDNVLILSHFALSLGFLLSFFQILFRDKIQNIKGFYIVHLFLDAVILTLCVYSFSARENIFSLLYLIYILMAAFLLYRQGAFFSVLFSCLCFAFIVSNAVQTFPSPIFSWFLYSFVFISFGILGGVFSLEILKTRLKIKELQTQAKQNEKLAAIGQLAAGIAHEIRNPLASMSASLQLLKDVENQNMNVQENKKLMSITLKEIDRLNGLVTEFLEYVKPSQIKFEKVDLSHILSEIAAAPLVEKKVPITVINKIKPQVYCTASPEKIKQIVWNLVINAAQAMQKEGTIELGCLENEDDKSFVKFYVADTGIGMSDKTLSHIFEPFFTTKDKGTGLGLATVYKVVEAMHGKILVTSELGVGTRFEVLIPKA